MTQATVSGVDGPLRDVHVLDLGQYLAGPLAALLLADQGARVIRIDPPGGPRWETAANSVLLRRRERRSLDLHDAADRDEARALVSTADVLIENFRPGVMERLGLGVAACRAMNSGLVYCSLPGFGRDDARATEAAWEGVVLAAAGAYATGSEEMLEGEWWPADGPAFSPLLLASIFGGIQGATAVTAALLARERDGSGQHVEVPLHDAFLEAIGARALSYERNAPGGATLGSGFYRCADGGYVSLITVWFRHLVSFVEAAGVGSWMGDGLVDFERLRTDPQVGQELKRRLVDLLATRTARAWERLGHDAGVPIAALRESRDWMSEDAAVMSGALVDDEDERLGSIRVPGPAVQIVERPRDEASTHGGARLTLSGAGEEPPLTGLRVLDMTRVLAAPSASRILAELGADVVKADADPQARQTALRQPVFHEQTNRGKRSIVVDLAEPEGEERLRKLLEWADVLVTNFTPPAIERLGLDEDTVRDVAPEIVYVYLNAFGTRGPWADLRGYAEIANTVTGITARTLGEGPPSGVAPTIDLPRCPFTDYAAGILGAFGALVGSYRRLRGGGGVRAETSLAVTASYEQLPYLVGHEGKCWDEPRVPALGWSARQRLYRSAEGWFFAGLESEQALSLLTGAGADPEDGTEERLEQLFASLPTDECLARVRASGGGAHEVVGLDTLFAPGGLADERGLLLVEDSDEFGTVVQPGPTMRFGRTPMRPGKLPRPFGAETEEILAELAAGRHRRS